MIEHYEFRVLSQYRDLLRGAIPDAMEASYGILVIHGVVGDRQFATLAEIERQMRSEGLTGIFTGWKITRSYSAEEIENAELLLVRMPITHISAEDYGAEYTESDRCTQTTYDLEPLPGNSGQFRQLTKTIPCSLCSKQATLVRLPVGKFQKKDLFRLVGGELIVSGRFRSLVESGRFVGADIYPVNRADKPRSRTRGAPDASSPEAIRSIASMKGIHTNDFEFWQWLFRSSPRSAAQKLVTEQAAFQVHRSAHLTSEGVYQLLLTSRPLEVSSETRFGDDPFDRSSGGHYRCGSGEIAGNMQLSPLKILRDSWDGADLCRTRIFIGGRQGYYRPYQILVVSKRLFDRMIQEKIKGFGFELAELV